MWQCPFCETINEDKVCSVCGELRPMPPAKTTSQNNQSTNALESASDVGLHTESVPLDPTPTLGNTPKKPKKKKVLMRVIAIVLALVLVVSATVLATLCLTGNNPFAKNKKTDEIETVEVGSYITFGKYEQDNNLSNGKEDIEWLVLAREGDKVLVISKYALDCKRYNEEYEDTTWAECTLCAWLNDNFYNSAFSQSEKSQIENSYVYNKDNPTCGTNGGIDTYDNVFLLSIEEAEKYFESNDARVCKPTPYAVANGAREDWKSDSGNCGWWLRSPGCEQYRAADVFSGGTVYALGDHVICVTVGVRPAMWITLE